LSAGNAGCHDHARRGECGSRLAAAGDRPRAAELGEAEDSQDRRAGMHQCDTAAHVVELTAVGAAVRAAAHVAASMFAEAASGVVGSR
jgi:hypothetical protein